ncbi:beta-lactamase family protein [Paenibacillus sp. SC116]|uniref:serine hydrolase domain-containing protein n=1 Tax=Paenibacillus sp. SC116 TaxID=2968986 RepID=UPI00215A8AC5|nr:serine hydrolase [Paenibacillus sp. SC116]MCR8842406.1 beta-lactamase family protein [Paenibacillus sp. SC116]
MKRNDWPTTTWQAIEPDLLDMDVNKLTDLDTKIKYEYRNITGVVIARHGYIAYEKYYNGYGPEDTHHVASVTKSILSALIGIATDKGFIKHIDQTVLDFFPDYMPDLDDNLKQKITIRHLLTMTVPYPFEDWREPLDKLCIQPDWVTYTLNMLGQGGNLGTFKYSTAGAHLLSAIITRSTGKNAREFANEHLFKPIGMQEISNYEMESFGFDDLFGENVKGWVHDPQGNSTGGWGLTLSPRDMARFGLLYLNRGVWDNQSIISEKWIHESTAMNPNHYGYLWWMREEVDVRANLALGDGGNVICCIPQLDLVVAIASSFVMNPSDRWTLIKQFIIPSIRA